ncbi:hypothetical protein JYU34_011088 [Plutella xylostella]|uniref:Odorant receptor n=1 Tax=Plutella xylostella TaxID=51655 RepID=A0ABQ7QG18_PLUXY|nr:hypothetical protein JYU34_011088 [Plutella xylostella]
MACGALDHFGTNHNQPGSDTFGLQSFYARQVGLFFTDDPPSNLLQKLKNKAAFVLSAAALLLLVAGELAYVLSLLAANTSVAEFVASLHIAGYGFISVGKMAIIWYKQDIFKQLVSELADLWPVRKDDGEAAEIKQRSLNALRFFHIFYTAFTVLGVALYNLTPIALHAWRSARGARSELGFVWHVAYPFDKRHPVYHKIAYAFEVCSGVSSVFFMLSREPAVHGHHQHITMLLPAAAAQDPQTGAVSAVPRGVGRGRGEGAGQGGTGWEEGLLDGDKSWACSDAVYEKRLVPLQQTPGVPSAARQSHNAVTEAALLYCNEGLTIYNEDLRISKEQSFN